MSKFFNTVITLAIIWSCISQAEGSCCDYPVLSLFCTGCYGKCVLRSDPASKLRNLLNEQLFGQQHVIEPISDMLDFWYTKVTSVHKLSFEQRGIEKNRMISFHIAGENGVGKSFSTTLIAKAVFQYNLDGFLLLSGTNFEGAEPDRVEEHRETLFNLIVQQLEKCPKSVIVIDEVQYIHANTLRILQQFMDSSSDHILTKDGRKIQKNLGLLGLVSDFGREGVTKDMSLDDLVLLVEQHTRELWDMDPKQAQLIQYTFPFVALSDKDIESLIRYKVTNELPKSILRPLLVRRIIVSEIAVKWMCYKVRKMYPHENGRGADKYIEKALIPRIKKVIKDQKPPIIVEINYSDQDLDIVLLQQYHDET